MAANKRRTKKTSVDKQYQTSKFWLVLRCGTKERISSAPVSTAGKGENPNDDRGNNKRSLHASE